MKPDQAPSNNLNNEEKGSALEKEKIVEEYILGTLLYTPQYFVKNEDHVEIKVYAPKEDRPSMQIVRLIIRPKSLDSNPENLEEIAFQDEVNVLKNKEMDLNERWQVNFSIFVDKENYQYKSIKEKPKTISHISESVDVFKNLAKQKGAVLYAGNWRFESDGNNWVPSTRDGNKAILPKMKSLMSGLPGIE
jgi:hypothetical protein